MLKSSHSRKLCKFDAKVNILILGIFIALMNIYFINQAKAQINPPVSTNYKLEDFAWGSGGTENSNSTIYKVFGISGELSENPMNSGNYKTWPGLVYTMMANVPAAPALSNPSNYYDRLKIVLAAGSNPTDAQYAIAVSPDAFATTFYLKADGTLTPTLTNAEFQTYAQWGGVNGMNIVGLAPSTTYSAKVKARHGNFTESPYGPTATAATSNLSIFFDIDVHATDSETNPPYLLSLNELPKNTVVTGTQSVWLDLTTNAINGATIYISGQHGGLASVKTAHTINSITSDLAAQAEGVGLQGGSVTQASGGPLTKIAPYNGAGNNVGLIPVQLESIFHTAGAIVSGRAAFVVKAKASAVTPAAPDYSETLTVVVAPSF